MAERQIIEDWSKYWLEFQDGETPATTTPHGEFLSTLRNGDEVLDLGCGYGRNSEILAYFMRGRCRVTGMDINRHEVTWANKNNIQWKNPIDYLVASGADIPFSAGAFDKAMLLGTLGGIQVDLRKTILREAARVIKPGGIVYAGEYAMKHGSPERDEKYRADAEVTGEYGSNVVRNSEGKILFVAHHFEQEELRRLFEEPGLEDVQVRSQIVFKGSLRNNSLELREQLSVWGIKA